MNNSNAIRVVAIVLGLLAIILAIVGWRMSRSFAESASRAQEQQQVAATTPTVPQIQVVIATRPLAANVPITSDAVVLAPVTIAPTEYFANVDDAIGRTPLIDIDAGAPVVPRFFKDANLIARGVPEGHRALSLKVDDVVGVGGFVRPGDTVDVLVFIKSVNDTPTGRQGGEDQSVDIPTQARVLIRDIRVLSYEEHLVEPPKGLEDEKEKQAQTQARRERTAVLAIPEAQVTKVLLGASFGELRLALHGSASSDTAAAPAVDAAAGTVAAADAAPAISATDGKPLTPEQKAKAEAEAELAAAQIITATELTQLVAKKKNGASLAPPKPPRIEIYRGSDLKTVSP